MSTRADCYPSLLNRVVLVTGGSRGLGREMALALAGQGARLAIIASRQSPESEQTVAELKSVTGEEKVAGLVADVTNFDDCVAAVGATVNRFGRIYVLINNAGLGMRAVSETYVTTPVPFWQTEPQAWRAIIDTNVNGAFHMARAAVPNMVRQGFGKLINITTSSATTVHPGYTPYGPSKAALEAMSRAWAKDLAGTGVDVNSYLPGGASATGMLPPGATGVDGNLFPVAMIRRGICWLCADDSNGRSGGRYVARLWDESLSPDEAARRALDMTY